MADSFLRQWKILHTIPRAPRSITINKIMAKLGNEGIKLPTHRTIQRDLDVLANVCPQLLNEMRDGAHHWYMDKEGTLLEIPSMEYATALAFNLAEQRLQSQLPPSALKHLKAHFNTAAQLLDQHDTPYAHWREKVRVLPQTQLLIPPDVVYGSGLGRRRR